jgi:tRNA(Ile)-lysidine synthase
MVLAQAWRSNRPAPRITVLTVDHGLRKGSRAEAETVARQAAGLGLAHVLLHWEGEKPAARLQETARKARYQLMAGWCRSQGAGVLVTAHTVEDQAETMLMRLARGTGIEGLAGMPVQRELDGVLLYRPLLHLTRERLRTFLGARGIFWIDDPSNEDLQFERIRVRKALPALAGIGITPAALEETAFRARRADQALNAVCEDFIAAHVDRRPEGYCRVPRGAFGALPTELRIRVLDHLILIYGPGPRAALSGLERLETWFTRSDTVQKRTTLAGCEIAMRVREFLLGREPGRIPLAPVPVDGQLLWDGRWDIRTPEGRQGLNVRPVRALSGIVRNRLLPGFVQAGLPAICDGDVPVCLPHSGQACREAGVSARFLR